MRPRHLLLHQHECLTHDIHIDSMAKLGAVLVDKTVDMALKYPVFIGSMALHVFNAIKKDGI